MRNKDNSFEEKMKQMEKADKAAEKSESGKKPTKGSSAPAPDTSKEKLY